MNTEEGLKEFVKQMKLILDEHQEKKGDSWVGCEIDYLEDKLDEEFREYRKTGAFNELVDVANICMMLYIRKRKELINRLVERIPPDFGSGAGR